MMNLSIEIKRNLYNLITMRPSFLGRYRGQDYNDLNIVDFLKLIWDLSTMPSEDNRFKNAEADAYQHLVNNDDWAINETFEKRFNLLDGPDEYFFKFLEAVVSPFVRLNSNEIIEYVELINKELLKSNTCYLKLKDYIDDLPYYKIAEGKAPNYSTGQSFCNKFPVYYGDNPKSYPAFVLQYKEWDDYSYKTKFNLYFWKNKYICTNIGQVKILKKDTIKTADSIDSKFFDLNDSYCSLGQSFDYYKNIKKAIGDDSYAFFYAMKDCAIFSKILDKFINEFAFIKSLTRDAVTNNIIKNVRYILAEYPDYGKADFIFKTTIPYCLDEKLSIRFNFGDINDSNNLNRIIALIGENGVGKTTIISNLAEKIVKNENLFFEPRIPIFSKVLSASYSIFDDFFNITNSPFNYKYCGIKNHLGQLMSKEEIIKRRNVSLCTIFELNRHSHLASYLHKILPFHNVINIEPNELQSVIEKSNFSSGQSMFLNLVIEIVANIRENTLILIDEPEIHLHPSGITYFIKVLDEICRDYNSCCIVSTHSSVVVQELLSRNVIIVEREEDNPVVRPMRIESMGNNLTTITEDIFGRNKEKPLYETKIQTLSSNYPNIESAIAAIQNNDVPVSMSIYLLLDKIFSNNDKL